MSDEDCYEWDDSKATLTTWSMMASKQRGTRTYGRRPSSTVPTSTSFTSVATGNNSHSNSRTYGRRKFIKQESIERTKSESSLKSESTLSSSMTKSQSTRSATSFSELGCDAINEENLNPNIDNSRLSFSSNTGACFSSICQRSPSDSAFMVPCLTPSRSTSSSSRKRGVCDSPLFHCDDMNSSGGLSVCNLHQSTSSFGSRRARSRIFSPESTKKIMEKAAEKAAIVDSTKDMTTLRKKNESFLESESELEVDVEDNDNSFEAQNTSCEMSHSDVEDEVNKNESQKKKEPLPLPLQPRRMSSLGDITFEEAIFAPVENPTKEFNVKNAIFNSMSSYEDLKFLLKQLRRWSNGKLLASFGMSKTCTVVPPNSWNSSRRSAFVEWTTNHLGFCHQWCGGGVNYLQIGISKAKKVHQDLEKALLEYKEANKKNRAEAHLSNNVNTENAEITTRQTPLPPMSSIKISRIEYSHTPMSIDKDFGSVPERDNSDDIVADLAGNLKALDIKKHQSKDESCDHAVNPEATPLTRMVTLPDETVSIFNSRPPRLSHDSSVMETGDFVSHMHGVSPQHNFSHKPRRSLSLPARQYSGVKNTMQMFSPCLPVITSALSFDQVLETPSVNNIVNRRWGSRPVPGRDWGSSERCDSNVIERMYVMFENSSSNVSNFVSEVRVKSTALKQPPVRPGMSLVRADSMSLGIEFEVNKNAPISESLDRNEYEENASQSWSVLEEEEKDVVIVDQLMPANDIHFGLNHGEDQLTLITNKIQRRRAKSFAKHSRMSICNTAMESRFKPFRPSLLQKKTAFAYQAELCSHSQHTLGPSPVKDINKMMTNEDEISSRLVLLNSSKLLPIMSFLTEQELQCTASLVCTTWADTATESLASLMLISVGCSLEDSDDSSDTADIDDEDIASLVEEQQPCSVAASMQRPFSYIVDKFPWGSYLSEGTFKRVFRVWNSAVNAEEAVSVMDVNKIDDANIVGNELAVSVMLSSLARRNVCPNFVKMRGVFTSDYEPPKLLWGCAENKQPQGRNYKANSKRVSKNIEEPSVDQQGRFQYIRMELCQFGDVEEFIKEQPNHTICPEEARCLLFQMAFSLHVAGDRFGLKHYDVKLLNFFLQSANECDITEEKYPSTVLRYGFGSHVFNLKMPTSRAFLVKLADFGTANTRPESNGQPVMLNNFTTIENTPPDFMILGDAAVQGYGHDYFGLGLCMLHLFTGDAPYEEILEPVKCPKNLKKKLKRVWEGNKNRNMNGYSVIQSLITSDLWEDENGNIEGEIDETLYDTLYRFLVLFGIPEEKFQFKDGSKVWNAISSCLEVANEESPKKVRRSRRNHNKDTGVVKQNSGLDISQFQSDCEMFSLRFGKEPRIARARESLESLDGGLDLLFSLVAFDPSKRASALDVINSDFMSSLREEFRAHSNEAEKVYSFMSYFAVREGEKR